MGIYVGYYVDCKLAAGQIFSFRCNLNIYNVMWKVGWQGKTDIKIGYLQHVILVHPQVCPNVGCHISQSSSFLILFLHVDLQKQC